MSQPTVYAAASLYQQGIVNLLRSMVRDFGKSKELIWRLFLRDFSSRHKQSLLGWSWIVLMPVMTMGTFLLLNMSGIIKIGQIGIPYPIFGLLSFSIWNMFANGLSVMTSCITGAGSLITKINFSKDSLVFASFGQVFVDLLIRLVLTVVVFLIYGRIPPASLLFFPLAVLPLVLMTIGLGMLTSLFQAVSKDVISFVNLGTNFLLLLMPIMYVSEQTGILGRLNIFNPLFYLVIVPRNLMLYGRLEHLVEFFLSAGLSLIIFIFGWMFFYLSQTKLAERV